MTTVNGRIIAVRRTGRVDLSVSTPGYRQDLGVGPSLKDGQAVAVYSYLGKGCYTSWVESGAFVICGLVAGEPKQEWWVEIVTDAGAKAWVNAGSFKPGTAPRPTDRAGESASATATPAGVGNVSEAVVFSESPLLTSAQEERRMSELVNRSTTPRIDLSRNALVFDRPPPDILQKPVRTEYVEPVYPAIALSRNVEHDVAVEAIVGADGVVHDVRVRGSRDDDFDSAVIAAVSRWKYSPAQLNGEAVSLKMTATVKFFITPKER